MSTFPKGWAWVEASIEVEYGHYCYNLHDSWFVSVVNVDWVHWILHYRYDNYCYWDWYFLTKQCYGNPYSIACYEYGYWWIVVDWMHRMLHYQYDYNCSDLLGFPFFYLLQHIQKSKLFLLCHECQMIQILIVWCPPECISYASSKCISV